MCSLSGVCMQQGLLCSSGAAALRSCGVDDRPTDKSQGPLLHRHGRRIQPENEPTSTQRWDIGHPSHILSRRMRCRPTVAGGGTLRCGIHGIPHHGYHNRTHVYTGSTRNLAAPPPPHTPSLTYKNSHRAHTVSQNMTVPAECRHPMVAGTQWF